MCFKLFVCIQYDLERVETYILVDGAATSAPFSPGLVVEEEDEQSSIYLPFSRGFDPSIHDLFWFEEEKKQKFEFRENFVGCATWEQLLVLNSQGKVRRNSLSPVAPVKDVISFIWSPF